MIPKPIRRLFIQYIGKMCLPRPYRRRKITAIFPFTKISSPHSLVIDRIPLFYFHPGVNDRDQADPPLLHFCDKCRKIRKFFLIHRKILIILHIINVHIDQIQRDAVRAVSIRYIPEVFFRFVSPSALPEPKGKFRRDITPADDLPELPHDIIRRFPFNYI